MNPFPAADVALPVPRAPPAHGPTAVCGHTRTQKRFASRPAAEPGLAPSQGEQWASYNLLRLMIEVEILLMSGKALPISAHFVT